MSPQAGKTKSEVAASPIETILVRGGAPRALIFDNYHFFTLRGHDDGLASHEDQDDQDYQEGDCDYQGDESDRVQALTRDLDEPESVTGRSRPADFVHARYRSMSTPRESA